VASIASLRLIDFRSYPALDVEFQSGAIALYGPNGAGKTNLLEAISLLSPGRGLRRAKVDLLARVDKGASCSAWGINACLHAEDDPTRISIGQVPEHPRRRQLKINGKPATGPELARRMSMLWLTPAQDRLFTGPASDRRKFIDRFTLAFSPDHGTNTIRFEPHRTEFHVTHKNKAMPAALCSTGEQKALLIGLILAQARALSNRLPILLLDEVAAHLDSTRRAALAEELLDLGLQVFMTGTDKSLFADFGTGAQILQVSDGQLC